MKRTLNLKSNYEVEKSYRAEYDQAKNDNDEHRMAALREAMKLFRDDIFEIGDDYAMLYRLYRGSHDNELVDLNSPHQYCDAEKLIAAFRKYGIKQFTFSSGWSSAVEAAWKFTQLGCKLEGMVEINGDKEFGEENYTKIPAYLFSID